MFNQKGKYKIYKIKFALFEITCYTLSIKKVQIEFKIKWGWDRS